MTEAQEQGWHGLFDIAVRITNGWTLVGGQMVHLHYAERGISPTRPTDDVDTVLDVRAHPTMLQTFTSALSELGFRSAGASPDGHQHRWPRDRAQIDVLIPNNVGPRAAGPTGVTGGTTVEMPAGQQALDRTEWVDVEAGGRHGRLPRHNLLAALIAKAAASKITARGAQRHLDDCAVLLSMAGRRDLPFDHVSSREKGRLATLAADLRYSPTLLAIPGSADGRTRLERALGLEPDLP
jgi:hypothetical protein